MAYIFRITKYSDIHKKNKNAALVIDFAIIQ